MTTSVFYCWYYPGYYWELEDTTFAWLIFGITTLASPVIVLLNVLEIAAVSRRRDLQRASTILLCSVAFADILIGVSMPLTAVVDLLIAYEAFLGKVCILDLICHVLCIHLCAVSLDCDCIGKVRGNQEMEKI